jgi:parvulin-like peptidyl-prolyl isomerase
MKPIRVVLLLGIAMLGANLAFAQDGDLKPIDEVIARVNAGVIMRSAFEAAQRDILDELRKQNLSPEELEKKFNEWKPRILDELVNTQLLAQRAKDLSINVEAQVNQQLLRMMKENNCESLECLGQKMREAGYDIDEVRKVLTDNYSKEAVLGQEVYGKVYRNLTEKEKREFYEKNKEFYTEPAEVTLSNIFIALGKDPNQSLLRAREIVLQARSGVMEFKELAKTFTESEQGKKDPSLGTFKLSDLNPDVKTVVEKAPAGSITDPVKLDNGYSVFRIDERKEAKQIPFEDERVQNHVARSLVEQQSSEQIEAFLARLRNDAFIEIDPRYQFEDAKVKSAQIKRVPYSEDNGKKKKKDKKEKDDKEAVKTTASSKP